jgi:hypothetical protein
MVEVKLAEPRNWSTAIIGSWGSASAGIGLGGHIEAADVKEGVESDHIHGHGVGPFEDLWTNVYKEGIGGPSAEDHDLRGAVVHKEERHGGARTDRSVPDLVRVEAKDLLPAIERASVAQELLGESVVDKFD